MKKSANNEKFHEISKQTVNRYSERYKKLGYNVKTLGWGSCEQQRYRFEQTVSAGINFNNKTVIDIGCGFGDYYDFLVNNKINIRNYTGWDINPELIDEAKKRHQNSSNVHFLVKDLLSTDIDSPIADIGVMLGVLNYNLKDHYDNYEFSQKFLSKVFRAVRHGLIVDFLSTQRFDGYPKEDFVFYHQPERMLSFAFSLTDDVCLKHDYSPIPQKEFMLILKK